ncbi:MAG: hypothetical protein WAO76_12415 [Georgfuchsia sp.]
MARTVFLLLVLLNLMAFAWIYLKGDDHINAGREPQRANSELAADKIRLVPAEEIGPESCRAFAGVTVAEAQEIAKVWSGKLPAAHITVNSAMPQKTFDLVITGIATRAAAEIKQAQLKNLGITEGVSIKTADDKQFEVLMASFKERSVADDALNDAAKKGVHSAVIVERMAVSAPATIEVRGDDTDQNLLTELASLHKGLAPGACEVARNLP